MITFTEVPYIIRNSVNQLQEPLKQISITLASHYDETLK